jgi:hypothetical protein
MRRSWRDHDTTRTGRRLLRHESDTTTDVGRRSFVASPSGRGLVHDAWFADLQSGTRRAISARG